MNKFNPRLIRSFIRRVFNYCACSIFVQTVERMKRRSLKKWNSNSNWNLKRAVVKLGCECIFLYTHASTTHKLLVVSKSRLRDSSLSRSVLIAISG